MGYIANVSLATVVGLLLKVADQVINPNSGDRVIEKLNWLHNG